MRKLLAGVGALTGAAIIALLALSDNESRDTGVLVRFEPAGLVQRISSRADEIEIYIGQNVLRLNRAAPGRWLDAERRGVAKADVLSQHVANGLHFLEVTAPSRVIDGSRSSQSALSNFGLAPPRYKVVAKAHGERIASVEFGNLNPSGTAQYVRVVGQNSVYLMPLHLGGEWEAVAAALGAAPTGGQP